MKHPFVRFSELVGLAVTTFIAALSLLGMWLDWPALLPWPVYLFTINSLLTYAVFRLDKKLAQRNAWRIKESSLHWMELMGGWPGAWAGMHLWSKKLSDRHKYNKPSYVRVTALITVVEVVLLGLYFFFG